MTLIRNNQPTRYRKTMHELPEYSSGFTLIEVMVSVIIFAIGLLGLASLHGVSLKENQEAYMYTQATLLAYEMGDRIKVNSDYWRTNIPDNPSPESCMTECNSKTNSCTAAELASSDYCYWKKNVAENLTSEATAVIAKRNGSTQNAPLLLTLIWPSRLIQGSDNTKSTDAMYQLEIAP